MKLKRLHRNNPFLSRVLTTGYLPRWGVLLIDMFISISAFVLSYLIGNQLLYYNLSDIQFSIFQQAMCVLLVQTICFKIYHSYAGILRFSTFIDTVRISLSVVTTGLLLLLINFIVSRYSTPPFLNSVIIIYIFVGIVFFFSSRVLVKLIFEHLTNSNMTKKPVLIYGTQSAGVSIARMLRANANTIYRPAGFITDSNHSSHHEILGLPVIYLNDKLFEYMESCNIKHVIISPLKMKQLKTPADLHIFLEHNITILNTPHFHKINSPEMDNNEPNFDELSADEMAKHIGAIEAIHVEDLLERPIIDINTENIRNIIEQKTVLVTGAAGSIGSEIVRQLSRFHPRMIVLFDIAESPLHDFSLDLKHDFPHQQYAYQIGDVRNQQMVENVFTEFRPQIVFHAAAYKHVPLMEEFPNQAVLANVLGTKNIADAAVKHQAERFVMISTDKAVNPTNVMGASKRIAELYVQSLFNKLSISKPRCTKFITTRFGNVLGSNGSVIPYFKKQIKAGGPVTVTHPDIIRYFMTIPEASCLVLEAVTIGEGGEIFCFDMGQPVRIADLARNMIRLAGYEPQKDIEIIYTGLRAGEKLYEELLNDKETTLPTPNAKIKIAKVREYDYDDVNQSVLDLIHEAELGRIVPCVKLMKKIVPEFKSKNSVYEELD